MKIQGSSASLYVKSQPGLAQKVCFLIKWRGGMLVLIFLIIFFCCLKLYTSTTILRDSITHNANEPIKKLFAHNDAVFYSVVIDAGSTGSRVHVYKFQYSPDSMAPILRSELFEQVKPGLSSYVETPKEGAASIEGLLKIAQEEVPKELWSSTVLALKATAGLRMLPKEQADNLLNEVRLVFKEYPFKLAHNPVEIMDGVDEGIFGWITVNYLLGKLGTAENNQFTVGTIDLGGGSVQLSFAPHQKETVDEAPEGFTSQVSVFGSKLTLYTHSYLGLGLMSAREATLKVEGDAGSTLQSACLPTNFNEEWENGQNKYLIEGIGVSGSSYDLCRESARSVVSKTMRHPFEIKHQNFYIFSYFFDRAANMNMIDEENGGTLTVQDYIDAAKKACSFDDFNKIEPYLCLDMSVIASILQDGFEFATDTRLITKKKINNKETSWTLGAAFFLLE